MNPGNTSMLYYRKEEVLITAPFLLRQILCPFCAGITVRNQQGYTCRVLNQKMKSQNFKG